MYCRGDVIYFLYTDDSILASRYKFQIQKAIDDIRASDLKITVEGDLQDFLGVHISRHEGGSIQLSQQQLAKQICQALGIKENTKPKAIPAASFKILQNHATSEPFEFNFNYRSIIGKMNYYKKCTRPDISYSTHQCDRYVQAPMREHGEAVHWLERYIFGTKDEGIINIPYERRGLEVYGTAKTPKARYHSLEALIHRHIHWVANVRM